MANTEYQIAWAAGFVDGEGSIGITRQGSITRKNGRRYPGQHHLRLVISQKDRAPLLIIQSLWGGYIHERKDGSGICCLIICGQQVENALTDMLPYLVVKRKQAEAALEFRSLINNWDSGRRLTEDDIEIRSWYHDQIKALNHGRSLT
jgi:hypothetical protein